MLCSHLITNSKQGQITKTKDSEVKINEILKINSDIYQEEQMKFFFQYVRTVSCVIAVNRI